MKDELKIFVEKNRESIENYHYFDVNEAWNGIETRLDDIKHRHSKIPWSVILKIAAVFFITMTVAIGFYLNTQRLAIDRNGIALHNISADLADTEAFYTAQIKEKIEMIEVSAGLLDPKLQAQLELLDEDYKSLKNDLADNADNEEVINAMIGYYRLKLAMLEKILEEIQKNDDNKDHEEALEI